jgi:hypothetical protein
MPLRYFIFSTLVLTAAFGLSSYVAEIQQHESDQTKQPNPKPLVVDQTVQAQTISGSSIAPGGVGGRQSQFSAVFGG